jgi:hypothetical protein
MAVTSIQRTLWCIFFLAVQLLFASPLFAQAPALSGPAFEASLGYVYDRMDALPSQTFDLKGIDGNGLVQFSRNWGGTIDLTYARTGSVFGIRHDDSIFSSLIGPVFFLPMAARRTRVFVHALAGIAWVDSAVPVSSTAYYAGYETRFSYAVGGGVERDLVGPFSVRATGDYQHTTFVNSTLALQGQNNLRLTLGVVYRFGSR